MCLGSKEKLSDFAGIYQRHLEFKGILNVQSWNTATHMHVVLFLFAKGCGLEGKETP